MATSSKKITYTNEFKLKVLDYYFKNGGDENFGLKKKTAGLFNIDKKTVNRMLNNPDMVKRARKLLSKKVPVSAKGVGGARHGGAKATSKTTKASGSKGGIPGGKLGTASTSGKITGSSHTSASNTSSSNLKAPTSSSISTKHVGSSNSSSQSGSTSTHTSTKTNTSKIKYTGQDINTGVQVFDLPEDPDYSLLKRSINASANGVANIARLLVSATEEVRNIILKECDMILECKVCHNLFRSVVNFLAHKRIYCQEEYADVRTLFHKDNVQGITSQSNTVVVEPEPPPDVHPHPSTSSASVTMKKPARTAMQGSSRIDSIATKLANRRKQHSVSHASHIGSSQYYERLSHVNSKRDKLSRDCSVVLEDIGGVANARYQTYLSPSTPAPTVSMNTILDEVSQRSSGLTVAINEHGEIMKTAPGNVIAMDVEPPTSSSEISKELVCRTCNTRFATQKTLSVHQRSHHGFERCIYCCPICKTTFLSMWAVVKHLQKYHKKSKNQTERLRKVIKKNAFKKMVYHSEDIHGEYHEMTTDKVKKENFQEEDQEVEDEEEVDVEVEARTHAQLTKKDVASPLKSTFIASPRKCTPTKSILKRDDFSSSCPPEHRCIKCLRKFMSLAALISHDKFCCLLQMRPDILPEGALNRRLRSERPEKKIAIQIRKDYKKSMIPLSPNRTNNSGEHKQNQITFKVPKIPKEQEKENQRKIEIMMSEFCNIECLTCIPCAKRYQSITALKRHASLHFNWTRFTCSLCKFRSYHKYETVRHTISDHNVDEHSAASTIMDDESFGPLRYFLDSEDDNSLSSDADELDSHGSHSRSTSASSGKISASCLNDNKNCNEKPEGTTENIKPPLVIKKSVNKSNAKDNISNEIPNMTSSEKKEGDDMVIESKLSDCVKIQNVEESEKVSYFQDESKTLVTGESTDSILDPSTDSAKFVSENVNRNLTQTDTTKNSTSGSQEDLNNSIIVLSFTDTQESDKGKLVQVDNESSKTILSVNNKNNEITNSSSESNIMKGNPNLVKPYPLRGQTDSSGHKNQIAEETEEGRFERPQRLRRSIEQKDFIYDTKRSGFQKLETEIGKRSITPKKGLERKFEDRPGTRRRNSSPRSEMPTKKMKIVNDGSPHETCNGTASQLLVQNKRIPTQPDTLIKGRNTQLPVTKGKDSNSSHQLPQMKQQHVNEELQGNSDNDDCSIPNKVENENIYETNKSNGNHNNSKPVSLITGANNDKLNIEEQEECNTSFISQSIENNILETEPQKKVMGTKLPDKDSEENIVVCPHIFENGKDQENNDTDKEEDEKGTRTHQHDNCKEMLWETGKEKKFVKDINTEEQKNSFADNKEHIKCTSS